MRKEIQAQGYEGSCDVVERFIIQIKDHHTASAKATLRFETPPGQQAQADWAHVGEDAAGKIYAFVSNSSALMFFRLNCSLGESYGIQASK